MKAGVVALLLSAGVAAVGSCRSSDAAGLPAASAMLESTVRLTITPGKPDAPTETVEIEGAVGGIVLRASRRSPAGELVWAETELDPAAHATVWGIVGRHRLDRFAPQPASGRGDDFGRRALHLEWRVRGEEEPTVHSVTWTGPLRNDSGVRELQSQLARLVASRLQEIPLYYFGSALAARRSKAYFTVPAETNLAPVARRRSARPRSLAAAMAPR